jgi:hypothetical protein|tara:strand:+ start:187 stop:549 length:363 start_codon:yes stop_codon:yes gene_type:complete
MQKIIPKNLMPVTKKVLRKLKQRDRVEKALFILEKESYEGKLSIFSFPNTLSNYNSRNFFINPKGTKRLEWYIRQTQKRSDDLWGSFSEELISLRLRNLVESKSKRTGKGGAHIWRLNKH